MPFSGLYPCMEFKDLKDPIRHLCKGKAEGPNVTKIFIEVQVTTKRVYRTKSGILLNHLQSASPCEAEVNQGLSSWRLFQIDFDDLLAKDVFHHCDVNSLLSMYMSKNARAAAKFVNFFKRRVSAYCQKIAGSLVETKPKVVVILARITTISVFDLEDDLEAVHSLKQLPLCEEDPYGGALLPKGAFLFSAIHGSIFFTDNFEHVSGKTCAICLEEFRKGCDVLRIHCYHSFHSGCLIPWFNKGGDCPVCRESTRMYTTRFIPPELAHYACRLQTF